LPIIIYTSLKSEELSAYKKVLQDLNVSQVLYKPEARLDKLLQTIDGQLAPVTV